MRARIAAAALVFCLLGAGPARSASFVDDSGRLIEFDRPFQRIISLYGAHTENLFSLGLDREIVGVSRHESFPPQALSKPVFSSRDDAERFLAARPDLVLIRPMILMGHRSLVDRLERSGIAVVSLQPAGLEGMFRYWRRLGELTGRQEAAEAMVKKFRATVNRLEARVAQVPPDERPRVYFESIHKKMKTFAPGAMAILALQTAGGVNVAPDARGRRGGNIAPYGKERILERADRIDVFLAQVGVMNRVRVADIKAESGFAAIKAIRENRVYLVDEKMVSRPTLRLLLGIRRIQDLLYPELKP